MSSAEPAPQGAGQLRKPAAQDAEAEHSLPVLPAQNARGEPQGGEGTAVRDGSG